MSPSIGSLDILTLTSVCILGAMSPGPSLFVILGVTTQNSYKAGIIASWTHAIGVGLWASLSLSGWHVLILSHPLIAQIISQIAALYLIYLALRLYLSKVDEATDTPTHELTDTHSKDNPPLTWKMMTQAGLAGFSISISNPKLLLFFSAIYPQVLPSSMGQKEIILALLIPIVIDGAWYHLVTIASHRLGLLKWLYKYQRPVMLMTALVFLFIAIRTSFTAMDWNVISN